jgi:autotransporter-associated beta strand protein
LISSHTTSNQTNQTNTTIVMKRIFTTIHAVALAAALVSTNASGATVLYDGFDLDGAYAFTTTTNAGVFTVIGDSDTPNVAPIAAGKNGGAGFTGGWLRWDTLSGGANNTSNQASLVRMSVQNLSLGYVDGSGNILNTAVGGLRRFTRLGSPLGSDGIQNLTSYRQFWTNGVTGPATGDTVYFSFIIAINNPIGGKWSLNNGLLTDTPAIAFGNSDNSATGDVTVNMFDANGINFTVNTGVDWATTTNLFVGRISNYGLTSQQLDFWINPSDITSVGSLPPTVTLLSSNGIAGRVFDGFRDVGGANCNGYFDEFRFAFGAGAGFANVLPIYVPPHQIRVETAADGSGSVVPAQSLAAGQSITNYAIARDAGNNFIGNVTAPWSLANITGSVANNNLVPLPGGKSAVFTAAGVGTAEIQAGTIGLTATNIVNSGTITVTAGVASKIRVETASDGSGVVVPAQGVPSGSSISVYSITRDAANNFVDNVAATWSLVNVSNGVVAGDLVPAGDFKSATFTANLAGSANIQATSGVLQTNTSGRISSTVNVYWQGNGTSNPWDTTSALWWLGIPGGTQTNYADAFDVNFDDYGSNNVPVSLVGNLSPRAVTVSGSTSYTFGGAGKITGTAAVTNSSSGTLTLLTTNDYTGGTVVTLGQVQLGNGVVSGSFGSGAVSINTGGTSPIFNRVDPVGTPFVVSNIISGPADFIMEFKSGAVRIAGTGNNNRATALVRNGARLILAKTTGSDLGSAQSAAGGTTLTIEAGGYVQLGGTNTSADHVNSGGKLNIIDGTFDLNGQNETLGPIQGTATGIIDNTSVNAGIVTVNNGVAAFGQLGEVFTFSGKFFNTGAGALGLTKDSTNTLVLSQANFHRGDTRIIGGGVLQLDHAAGLTNSTLDLQATDTGRLSFGTLTTAVLGGLKGGRAFGITNESGAAVAITLGGNAQANIFSGVIADGGAGSPVTKVGAGAMTLSGTNTYTGNTTVNDGSLFVNGRVAGNISTASGATLGGNGTIVGATTLSAGSTLLPGSTNNLIGTLTVNSTVSLAGTVRIELNRSNSPTSDRLAGTSISLGGSLIVTNIGTGSILKSGDSFTLFTGTQGGAGFGSTTLPALWPGLTWNTSGIAPAGSGIISVTGTATPPVTTVANISGGNFVLQGSGGLAGAAYRLLSSTNVALPLASWTRVSTNIFSATGTYTNAISLTPVVPQRFFAIEVP